jgi:hypothetical protein
VNRIEVRIHSEVFVRLPTSAQFSCPALLLTHPVPTRFALWGSVPVGDGCRAHPNPGLTNGVSAQSEADQTLRRLSAKEKYSQPQRVCLRIPLSWCCLIKEADNWYAFAEPSGAVLSLQLHVNLSSLLGVRFSCARQGVVLHFQSKVGQW